LRPRGLITPAMGAKSPALCCMLLSVLVAGCSGGDEETTTLEPIQLGMTGDLAPIYEDDMMTLYEVKRPVALPVLAPDGAGLEVLRQNPVEPYGRQPWVTIQDVRVQVTWTVTNLDDVPHNVEILIDPWNEFGRYWPGLTVVDAEREELMPNLSGIDLLRPLAASSAGDASRLRGTFTFDDMEELAIDFATVMHIIKYPPPDDGISEYGGGTVAMVNHAFALENRSHNDPLVQGHVPDVIAGLTGFDLGLRTYEQANVAIEIVVEVVDTGNERLRQKNAPGILLEVPTEYVTVAFTGP